MGGILLIIKLASIENNNVPYLIPFSPFNKNLLENELLIQSQAKETRSK
jgi:hypothetical protein